MNESRLEQPLLVTVKLDRMIDAFFLSYAAVVRHLERLYVGFNIDAAKHLLKGAEQKR